MRSSGARRITSARETRWRRNVSACSCSTFRCASRSVAIGCGSSVAAFPASCERLRRRRPASSGLPAAQSRSLALGHAVVPMQPARLRRLLVLHRLLRPEERVTVRAQRPSPSSDFTSFFVGAVVGGAEAVEFLGLVVELLGRPLGRSLQNSTLNLWCAHRPRRLALGLRRTRGATASAPPRSPPATPRRCPGGRGRGCRRRTRASRAASTLRRRRA